MLLLALDTSDARGSVAVLRDNQTLHVVEHDTADDYSVWLLPAIDRALSASAITFADIHVFVAAAGPGSFTGVRVGLATIKAWAEVTGKPIVSVSRMEALASEAQGPQDWIAAFANAQRNQIFAAIYHRQNETLERLGDELVIAPDKFLALATEAAQSEPIAWISTDPQMLTETEHWQQRQTLGERVHAASPILAPAVGRLGYHRAQIQRFADPLTLDANYVRRSDAELFWKDRNM